MRESKQIKTIPILLAISLHLLCSCSEDSTPAWKKKYGKAKTETKEAKTETTVSAKQEEPEEEFPQEKKSKKKKRRKFRGFYTQWHPPGISNEHMMRLKFIDDKIVEMYQGNKKLGTKTARYKIKGNQMKIKHACGVLILDIRDGKLSQDLPRGVSSTFLHANYNLFNS